MTFKESYQKYNEEIKPDGALVKSVLAVAQREKTLKSAGSLGRKTIGMKRESKEGIWTEQNEAEGLGATGIARRILGVCKPLAAVAAACLCLLITMPVLADNMPVVEKLLNLISPELAEQFVPVQMVDESQGIRMEVVAINVKENSAQVYVTLQDMEGNRLDETTDLYDSASLHVPFDSVNHCQNLGYDEESKTITFLISISAMEGAEENWYEKISSSRITFSIRQIIGQKTEHEDIEIPISLTGADLDADAMGVKLSGGSGNYVKEEKGIWDGLDPRPSSRVLRPAEADARFPVEGIEFTGMGYVDGYLHIQYAVPNRLENDNHGHFFLKDAQGNVRMYDGKVSFWGTTDETEHIDYEDCIFDISPEELENYTLHGYFMTSGLQLEGNWEVKFRLGE